MQNEAYHVIDRNGTIFEENANGVTLGVWRVRRRR